MSVLPTVFDLFFLCTAVLPRSTCQFLVVVIAVVGGVAFTVADDVPLTSLFKNPITICTSVIITC